MSALVFHVSLPERSSLRWSIPQTIEGESAHYLYDISFPIRRRPRPGSKVYLWGSKRAGKYGLFASGTCEKADDQSVRADKEHDAFALIRHDRVLERAIGPGELLQEFAGLAPLVKRLESSTMLEFFPVSEDQARMLETALSRQT